MDKKLTVMRLRELLSYNQDTGNFTWNFARQKAPAGKIAGRINDSGYRTICIDAAHHRAQRLAWLYVHGVWPTDVIDHINGIRSDNRIGNLRDVSQATNAHNTRSAASSNKTTGLLGAYLHKPSGLFAAQIRICRKLKTIGYFKTAQEAHDAYKAAKRIHHSDGCTI